MNWLSCVLTWFKIGGLDLDYWICDIWWIYCTGCDLIKLNAAMSYWHVFTGLFHGCSIMPHWQLMDVPSISWSYLPPVMVEYMYSVIVFILLGVSSRVCCLPADRGKGVADRPWAWRAGDCICAPDMQNWFPSLWFQFVFGHVMTMF